MADGTDELKLPPRGLATRGFSAVEQRRAAHGATWQADLDDPLMGMPEPARNLVQAAKRIIARHGLAGLTLNAVAREAGENKATTAYYFGNKDGLVAAVHDSVIHDEYIAARALFEDSDDRDRVRLIIEEMKRISSLEEELRLAYELIPHALRHEALGDRLRELYTWYADMKRSWLQPWAAEMDAETMDGLLELLAAVMDGIGIQYLLQREGFDTARAYRVLEIMLRLSLPRLAHSGGAPPATEGTPIA
jgi:TetR/AcrR family acrAB operon transcriptional repressor